MIKIDKNKVYEDIDGSTTNPEAIPVSHTVTDVSTSKTPQILGVILFVCIAAAIIFFK